jgi:hypothetical protein
MLDAPKSFWPSYAVCRMPSLESIAGLIDSVRIVISERHALDEAAKGLKKSKERRVVGKILLTI